MTENYAAGSPVMRDYGGIKTIENLDNSPYGRGWLPANLDSLVIQTNGVSLADGNRNLYFFMLDTWDPQPSYLTPDALAGRATLAQNSDGSYTLTYSEGSSQQFNAAGQLVTATDRDGNSTSYTYTSGIAGAPLATLTDARGTTTFNYTGGLLTSVVDFAGRTTAYTYDSSGRVASVTLPSPGHGEATPTKTFAYDPVTGLVASYTDSTGTTSITYGIGRAVTRITHPDGTYQTFNAPLTQALVDTAGGLGAAADPAALVPVATIIGTTTDEAGHVSQYTVDASGNTLTATDATGGLTSYTYTATGKIASITSPPLTPGGAALVTTLGYDANGNLDQETFPDGASESWTFDTTWNEPTQFVDPAGRETDYTLDPNNGDILTVTQVGQNGDASRVTTYTYTPAPTGPGQAPGGLVATTTDPRGIETEYSYTSFGAISSIVFAAGTSDQASVSLTYDQNENPASYTNELGQTTLFVYDNSDRKIEQQGPPPTPGAARPVETFTYNADGQTLTDQNALGGTTQYVYNSFGEVTEEILVHPDLAYLFPKSLVRQRFHGGFS